MENKTDAEHIEKPSESPTEVVSFTDDAFAEGDKYGGIDLKTCVVFLAVNLVGFAQILNIIGSGAYAQQITAVVGGADKRSWLTAIVTIIASVGGVPVSQAADYWGRKWFLAGLSVCGFVGCIVVARATSINMVFGGEIIAGIAQTSFPLVYAVSSEILPRRYRPLAQAGINVSLGFGSITSLLVGPAMMRTTPEGFRNFWYMACAMYGVAIFPIILFYNPPPRHLQSVLKFREKLQKLDWIGYALLAGGLVLFNIGLFWSENPYPWSNVHVLAPLLIGITLLVALALHQILLKKDGLFNHALFSRDRNFALSLFCILIEGMFFFAANAYFFFEVSVLYQPSLLMIGLRYCVTFFTIMAFAPAFAVYTTITKKVRWGGVLGFISFMIFNILMASLTLTQSRETWIYPIFLGIGLGVCLTSIITVAQLSVPPDLIALASGLLISVRFLGGAIALAIYNAAFDNKLNSNLGSKISAAVLPLGLSISSLPDFIQDLAANDIKGLTTISGITPEIIEAGAHALLESYLVSFRSIWIIAAALAVVATIAACFIIDPKDDLNMHVDAPLGEQK